MVWRAAQYPTVAIIVPAYNEQARIATVIEALLAQDYPSDRFEIFVVDNNSSDQTSAIASKYPIRLLSEKERQNAETARNRAIAATPAEIIAFTDADCRPHSDWLTQSIRTLQDQNADLVAGKICFTFASAKPSPAEIYDSLANLQHHDSVKFRGVAFTANLLIKSEVLRLLGGLDDSIQGGADLLITRKASQSGYKLVYSPHAKVDHPARSFPQLAKKAWRIGIEKGSQWNRAAPLTVGNRTIKARPHFLLLDPLHLQRRLSKCILRVNLWTAIKVYFVALSYPFLGALGFIRGLFLSKYQNAKNVAPTRKIHNNQTLFTQEK